MDERGSDRPRRDGVTRRGLFALGGAGAVGLGLALAGCSDDEPAGMPAGSTAAPSSTTTSDRSTTTAVVQAVDVTSGTPASTVFTSADFAQLGVCRPMPELTEGPFPTVAPLERRDITEGVAGHPLRVGVQIVDRSCAPIAGAVVDIWHCDADGDYSGYADGSGGDDAGDGTTFLRGSQRTNQDGIVEFRTVHPGWYSGRAVHIHAKVQIDDVDVLATQFLFDDAVNTRILSQAPYARRGEPDTTNAEDGVARGDAAASGLLMTVGDDAAVGGSRALIVVGVDR